MLAVERDLEEGGGDGSDGLRVVRLAVPEEEAEKNGSQSAGNIVWTEVFLKERIEQVDRIEPVGVNSETGDFFFFRV